MKTFHYKGYDAAGQPKKGLIEADSIKAVRETLAESGILAEKISASSRAPAFAVGAFTYLSGSSLPDITPGTADS